MNDYDSTKFVNIDDSVISSLANYLFETLSVLFFLEFQLLIDDNDQNPTSEQLSFFLIRGQKANFKGF